MYLTFLGIVRPSYTVYIYIAWSLGATVPNHLLVASPYILTVHSLCFVYEIAVPISQSPQWGLVVGLNMSHTVDNITQHLGLFLLGRWGPWLFMYVYIALSCMTILMVYHTAVFTHFSLYSCSILSILWKTLQQFVLFARGHCKTRNTE